MSHAPCSAEHLSAPELVQLLRSGTEHQRQDAAYALSIIHHDNQVAIVKAGGNEPLISLVARGSTGPQKEAAAQALSNLASIGPDTQTAIVRAGGVAPLVALVREGSTAMQKEAGALALATLAYENAQTQAVIVQSGGVEPLTALAAGGSESAELALECINPTDSAAEPVGQGSALATKLKRVPPSMERPQSQPRNAGDWQFLDDPFATAPPRTG